MTMKHDYESAAAELASTADSFSDRSDTLVIGVTIGTIRAGAAATSLHGELVAMIDKLESCYLNALDELGEKDEDMAGLLASLRAKLETR